MSTDDLVARLRAGDEAAVEEMVRFHGPRMIATATRLLEDESEAQDAVQESFLAALDALPGFRGEAAIGTWLHRIVVNRSLERLRSRSRQARAITSLLPRFRPDGHQVERSLPWAPAPIDGEDLYAIRDLVRRSLAELPLPYRTVLLLRDVEELSTNETASLLGISPGAVKVRLHRARQALRTLLDPHLRREP